MRVLLSALLLGMAFAGHAQETPFSPSLWLRYGHSPAEITKLCAEAGERAGSAFAAIASLPPDTRAFANTPEALEAALTDLSDQTSALSFLKYVSTAPAVREAAHACETKVEKLALDTFTRADLFLAIEEYARQREKLVGEPAKLLEKTRRDFTRNGLGLPQDKRAEIKALKERLVELQLAFGKNLNEVKDSLLVTRAELAGLPEDYIARLGRQGDLYRVTLDTPDYMPFMNNADDGEARRRLQTLYDSRAADANLPLIKEALQLRQKAAGLLGYGSHAAYVLEERMAKKPGEVVRFLERLEKRLKPLAQKELAALLALKKEREGSAGDGVLRAWEWRYYDNLLKKTRYEVDDEAIKEYFPLETVLDGMLAVYQRLLGLHMRQIKNAAAWHEDVKLYEITDAADHSVIGYFYMDLFPRDGKFKHAAAFTLIKGRSRHDGGYEKPVSAIVANFNKPAKGRPSLLKHREVETLFHEFGHIMHQTLTKARFGRFSGSSTARDFVEAPSQMLQNWVWQEEILASLSGHYKRPKEKLPSGLLKKMIAAKNVNAGLFHLRQAFFGLIDMHYHVEAWVSDTTAEYARLMEKVSLIPMTPGTHPEASFSHIVDMGYDSGYYGYLWSKVYAEDMFSRFEAEGVLNPSIGRLYRAVILEPGGGEDEAKLLVKFLGREPKEDAFLRSIGLTGKED